MVNRVVAHMDRDRAVEVARTGMEEVRGAHKGKGMRMGTAEDKG